MIGNFYTSTTPPPTTNLAMAFFSPAGQSSPLHSHHGFTKYHLQQQLPRAFSGDDHDHLVTSLLIKDQSGLSMIKTSSSSSSSNQVVCMKVRDDRDQTLSSSCDHDHDKLMEIQAAAVALPNWKPPASSLRISTDPNMWAWEQVIKGGTESKTRRVGAMDHHDSHGDHQVSSHGRDHVGVSPVKMKKMKARRKMREPRFCFKTMSDVDVLDDGYKWRKYGQKVVKNTQHPRSYYRCTQDSCRVKKRVERLADDPRMVITTYEGRHAHSPPRDQDQDESHGQLHLNSFFW
ncbi:putative WRKY transcription factor 13 [Drosera capensis]